ncbi:MAG: hypothetical protein HYX68_24560 [Planctomycetes bacterium]|nr:hypothetical protein [Planctomycetota bacterium]
MKALRFVLIGALVVVASAVPALAQRVKVQRVKNVQRVQVQPRPIQRLGGAVLLTPEAIEKLKLTAEQKDKYAKIDEKFKDATKAAQDAFRTAIQGVRDREKYKEANAKLQEDTKKARDDGFAKTEAILTAEQKTVLAQVKQLQPRPGVIRPIQPIGGAQIGQVLPIGLQNRLNLTDDQKKALEKIQKETEAKLMKVLTDEQKKQLEQFKRGILIRPRPIQPGPNPRILPVRPNLRPQPAPDVKKD